MKICKYSEKVSLNMNCGRPVGTRHRACAACKFNSPQRKPRFWDKRQAERSPSARNYGRNKKETEIWDLQKTQKNCTYLSWVADNVLF